MLVAIMGSQGSGKSTILNGLNERGYNVVDRKTSRSILQDWGVSLQEVNNNPDLTIKFQEEIIIRKAQDEERSALLCSNEIWFTERTFVDLFTYALVSLGKDNQYSEWLDEYYKKCMVFQQRYDYVYYLTAGHFNVEYDGVRGSNRHYSTMVDTTMLEFTNQMTLPHKLNIIRTPDLNERLTMISTQVEAMSR